MDSQPSLTSRSSPSRDVLNGGLASAPVVSSKGQAPLMSKVTSILSTSYTDAGFRDSLALYDEREAMNDSITRRQLRLNLQKDVIDCNGEIISEFGRVAEQMQRIRGALEKLNSGYQDINQVIAGAHAETHSAIDEVSIILQQRRQVEGWQDILAVFIRHFVMSNDEIAALTLTDEPVDDYFFETLVKANRISKDCEVLLGCEKQTLGLELLEQASKNINLGFQKLYKWVQKEFKTLNLENPQMNSSIRRALRVLSERPSLFHSCLGFFAEARERILSDSFYMALTGEAKSGAVDRSSKPIDLTAHDPLRYVGDMLAWLHSATVSEREALEVLFIAEGDELVKGFKVGRDADVWRSVNEESDGTDDFDALKALHDLVDRDISGSARVLKQRIEQVIQSNEEIIPAHKLANLLMFYNVTFDKLLGSDSGLSSLMKSLQTEAMRQFRALVRDRIATLQSDFQQPPSDLGPPYFLQESLEQLMAFIHTYDTSLSSTADRVGGFQQILVETLDPFLLGCENMAKAMKIPDNAIFLLNCSHLAISALGDYDFTASRSQEIREKMGIESKALVTDQHGFFRKASGLNSILSSIDRRADNDAPALAISELAQASQTLDNFLPSALMDATERLEHLQDSALTRQITDQAAAQFCADFENLESVVLGADDGNIDEAGSLRSTFPRTTTEIRVLLS